MLGKYRVEKGFNGTLVLVYHKAEISQTVSTIKNESYPIPLV
jgi:hypothetical protein